ncbi:MAG: selenocysteine-specific translation elongation factor [Chitinivibrionales bacterium]|nr:selenocysteine-specific translation elongation factor [Chitinivibrionales bacterium]
MPKHLIMGTAGHIDHGKTALVRVLTGIECDTHKDEKRRGITINLGFAHLDLANGDSVGIVDVPGHKNFVHTMVSGACGIDFALMVVAADSGIMPQTREHLQIMEVLGISKGLIALTKIDLVDEEVYELAKEEVSEFVEGTFLANAPVIGVSSKTGKGIDEIKEGIETIAATIHERLAGEIFRMFIDRIFTVSGFGTVVTGSALSGIIHRESKAYLVPGEKELRVRRIERHEQEVESARAGDRASLNLVGLNREEFQRGMVISDRPLRPTMLLDVKLRLFEFSRLFNLWTHSIFILGTYESQVRIHLIDKDNMRGGDTALAQVHLPEPCIARAGDRFVIRSTSSDITLGGGEVIDSAPLHHKRRPQKLLDAIGRIAEGKLPELVAAEVNKHVGPVGNKTIAEVLNVAAADVAAILLDNPPETISVYADNDTVYAAGKETHVKFREIALRKINAFHKHNPMEDNGLSTNELLGMMGVDIRSEGEPYVRCMLEDLEKQGLLKKVRHTWARKDHEATIPPERRDQINFVENFMKKPGMKVPIVSELEKEAEKRGIEEKWLRQILRFLVKQEKIYFTEGVYLHASVVDPCREKLLNALVDKPEGVTVAEFRDIIQGNRKICVPMINIFDSEGYTQREDDKRVITKKGRQYIQYKGKN